MIHLFRDWVPKASDDSVYDDNFVILGLQGYRSMFLRPRKPNYHIYHKYPKNFFHKLKIFLIKWKRKKKKKALIHAYITRPSFLAKNFYLIMKGKQLFFI